MNSIGYNGRRFYTGLHYLIDAMFAKLDKKLTTEVGHGKVAVFIGYRFKDKHQK